MAKLLLLLALCAACSAPREPSPPADPPSYGTQTSAPSPDYRALLKVRKIDDGSWRLREATTPLPPDAKAIGEAWIARLEERGALLGYGLAGKTPDDPVSQIDTGLTREEFDAWARGNGWRVPAHIRWSFVPPMSLPPVAEATKDAIRIWPASTPRTGIQHQALFQGRVALRDGCFFVRVDGEPGEKLAWFHAEVGLDRDEAGYLILRDRVGGQTLARLGERMNWAGPASAVRDPEVERAVQHACGPGEIFVVGTPESTERFLTQFPHLRSPRSPPRPPDRGK